MAGEIDGNSCEYHLGFSERLIFSAHSLCNHYGLQDVDTMRAVCYQSLLACEVALKAALEKAGRSISHIKARRHDISGLLGDLGGLCEIQKEVFPGQLSWVPATDIRSKSINLPSGALITLGKLLDDTSTLTSEYPNEIRYGDLIRHYPPDAVLACAQLIVYWVKEHWSVLRIKAEGSP